MKRRLFLSAAAVSAAGLGLGASAHSASAEKSGWESVTLKQALENRRTQRSFAERELEKPLLMDLLWAAWGYNRNTIHKRTAPSALNRQETSIFVVRKNGTSLYDAANAALKPHKDGDLRGLTGTQSFVPGAPVNLVYVADYGKMGEDEQENLALAWADTGYISQNVYLFCAAAELATVVRASVKRPPLAKALGLSPSQHITMAQSLGWPK